jgi:catechol 2,3-dioxygenase-like lactoylglutathione lyase family enzyme
MMITMKLRIARHTDRLEEVVAFYRDGAGFRETGRFSGHAGYDGVFLDIPGTGTQLELTTGGEHGAADPHPESLLVLYLDSEPDRDVISARLAQTEVVAANPYWRANARAYADPDGFQLLLVVRPQDSGPA